MNLSQNKKKVFVLCATKSGLDLLNLIKKSYNVFCVITAKTSKNSSPERISAKKYCVKNRIKCIELKNYSNLDEIKKYIQNQKIDVIISISWQRIIPQWFINSAKIACLGAHGSHQGMYLGRGRSPINWSILAGKKKFKLSLFLIQKDDADSGPEIYSKNFNINDVDNVSTIYLKCHLLLSEMIIKFLKKKKFKYYKYYGKYRFLPKLTAEDGQIDWNRDSKKIYDFIRSKSSPYPPPFTFYKKQKININSAKVIDIKISKKLKPGTIYLKLIDNELLVKTKDSFIKISLNYKNFKKIRENEKFLSANFKIQVKKIINLHKKKFPKNKLNNIISRLLN